MNPLPEVLRDYLVDLLDEPEVAVTQTALAKPVLLPADFLIPPPQVVEKRAPPLPSEADPTQTTSLNCEPAPATGTASAEITQAQVKPSWAQSDFDVLLCEVHRLLIALPLITLGQIRELGDLHPLPGQPAWLMGLQGQIQVVNTARYLMPERYDANASQAPAYVVSLADCDWGLAVDRIHQPERLSQPSVKWRQSRAKQPWLAGVVKERMCVLIDVGVLTELLNNRYRPLTDDQ